MPSILALFKLIAISNFADLRRIVARLCDGRHDCPEAMLRPKRAAGEMTKLQYRDFGIDRQGITLVLAVTVLALVLTATALWIGLR